jgi:branched-chain amino acid transport system substrate-binding protein
MSAMKKFQVCAAVVLVAAAGAGCSSSGGGSAPKAGSTAGSSGKPITLGYAVPISSSILSFPQSKAAMDAAISAINAAGGVNGHQLKDIFCDTKYTANGELACMRQLTTAKVSAIVAPLLIQDQSGAGLKVATNAGIPVIGTQGLSPHDFTIPGVYPIGSGNPGLAYGAAAALVEAGAKKIALLGSNEPGTYFMFPLITTGLKDAGLPVQATVRVDPTSDPTFAAGAAKVLADHPDGVVVLASPTYVPLEVSALRQAGYTDKISTVASVVPPQIIKTLGANANGILVSSQLQFTSDAASPAVAAFQADMKKYQPQAVLDEESETTYAATKLFATVMAQSTSFTASDVISAFKSLSSPVNIGLAGPFQVEPSKVFLPAYPQIYNATVSLGSIENGVLVTNGHGFVNPFTLLSKQN